MIARVGIIGYPLGHSVSPALHQAAFDHYGLDARFLVWETPPDQLIRMVEQLRSSDTLGASVTVPHKQAVIPLLDTITNSARAVGAVNGIVNQKGKLTGHNVDTIGFSRSLKEYGGFDPYGKRVLLLGAGGAARAVAHTLVELGVGSITVANRGLRRAQELVGELGIGSDLQAVTLDNVAGISNKEWDLIVNSTTLGMRYGSGETLSPLPAEVIPRNALVYDLVYNPPETPLIREAKKVNARTIGGLSMLVYQGAEIFQLWTGIEAPFEVMFQAAEKALHAQQP